MALATSVRGNRRSSGHSSGALARASGEFALDASNWFVTGVIGLCRVGLVAAVAAGQTSFLNSLEHVNVHAVGSPHGKKQAV